MNTEVAIFLRAQVHAFASFSLTLRDCKGSHSVRVCHSSILSDGYKLQYVYNFQSKYLQTFYRINKFPEGIFWSRHIDKDERRAVWYATLFDIFTNMCFFPIELVQKYLQRIHKKKLSVFVFISNRMTQA